MPQLTMNIDDDEIKALFKQVIREMLQERNELLYEALAEVFEDIALAEAIREGEQSAQVSRDEVFKILEAEIED